MSEQTAIPIFCGAGGLVSMTGITLDVNGGEVMA
jgi:hypothetical protein